MRVGIVTIFDNCNIGNRLQNYALQNAINRKRKQCVSLKNKNYKANQIQKLISRSSLAENTALNYLLGKKRKSRFLYFNDCSIKFNKKTYWFDQSHAAVKKEDMCALYCAGSDQTWNPLMGRSGMFNYLGFAERDRTFSYAASFGIDHIPEEFQEEIRKGLMHIKFLSVREDAGKRIVEELTGRTDVQVHVDPTLLLTTEEWDAVSVKPKQKIPEQYVLTYFLGGISPERRAAIAKKAEEMDCEIINLMDKEGPYYNNGPSEFLWLIKHAQLVCTDSFHGSVFSFLYGRPLAIYDRKGSDENMSSRLETLSGKFGLQECMVLDDSQLEIPMSPDYSQGYAALEVERRKSKDYFDMVFQEAERLGLCD